MNMLSISSLSQDKLTRLNMSASKASIYLIVSGYFYDKKIHTYFYCIESGVKCGSYVSVSTYAMRYSELLKFDSLIKENYPDFNSSYITFPGKKYIGNRNPAFIEQRATMIQVYFDKLIQLPGMCDMTIFQKFIGNPVCQQ